MSDSARIEDCVRIEASKNWPGSWQNLVDRFVKAQTEAVEKVRIAADKRGDCGVSVENFWEVGEDCYTVRTVARVDPAVPPGGIVSKWTEIWRDENPDVRPE